MDPHTIDDRATWLNLLERVSHAYDAADQDRYTVERSLEISSHEMQDLHRELQLERDQFEAVLVSLTDGICRVNADWRLEYANPQAQRMLGIEQQSLEGSFLPEIAQLCSDPDGKEPIDWEEVKKVLSDGSRYSQSDAFLRVGNDTTPISVVASPVRSENSVAGAVFSLRDITEKKRDESKVQEAKVEAEAARRAEQSKSDFLAVMSHEIRTPLNGVVGLTDILLETDLTADQRQMAESARECSDHLLTVINDILDFSKIEADKLTIESVAFDLRRLVGNTADILAFSAQEKGLELITTYSSDLPSGVFGDPGRLRQVLFNLLGNALKFTSKGKIEVEVTISERDSDSAKFRVAVHDSGIGIPKEKLDTIFDPFAQADASTTRRFGGTGLGLSICHRLIGLMGGTIGVESGGSNGSSFWFELSLSLDSQTEKRLESAVQCRRSVELGRTAETGRRQMENQSIHVLIAEDNPIIQNLSKRQLERLGCQVDIAENGRVALEMTQTTKYGVIFMDCLMPEMDGYRATSLIRERESEGERIPIIAMTANALPGDRETCIEAGMDDYISKPVDTRELESLLNRWASDRRADSQPGPDSSAPDPASEAA